MVISKTRRLPPLTSLIIPSFAVGLSIKLYVIHCARGKKKTEAQNSQEKVNGLSSVERKHISPDAG